jgi:predicted Zn-dependent protease
MQSHYLLAIEWARLENFGDAARSAAHAYQIFKLDQPLLTFMGALAYHQGRYDLAQEMFAQAVKLVPIQKEPKVYYAFTSLRLGQYQNVISVLLPVYKQFPNDGEIKAILGTAYYKLGLIDEAKKLIPYDEKTKKFEIQENMDKF